MITDIELAKMSHAINLRLSYYVAISYANLLAESSIRYPIVEYLERRLGYKTIKLEHEHEVFKRTRCDVYVERKKGNETEKIIFEFKYVRDNTSTLFQDYFDDLLRLHYLHEKGIQSLFVVCGNPINFNNQFRRIKSRTVQLGNKNGRPCGVFSQILSFSIGNPNKRFSVNDYRSNYRDFRSHYEFIDDDILHPDDLIIQTRLISLIYKDGQQSVGIWEVT